MSCKRSAKTQLPAVASNSHGGLPQRLSKRCLALIIPRIKQAYATHQLKLLKLEKQNQEAPKATQNQLRSTQGYARRRTSTGQHTKEVLTFHRTTGSRHNWAFRSRARRGFWVKQEWHAPGLNGTYKTGCQGRSTLTEPKSEEQLTQT